MVELTSHDEDMSRSEAAAMLRSIAEELDSGSEVVSLRVGNKEVRLSPPEAIGTEVSVTERSRRLRKDVEAVVLEFEWNPTGATAESNDDDPVDVESPTEPQSDPGVER